MNKIFSAFWKNKLQYMIFMSYTLILLFFLYLPKINSLIFPAKDALNVIIFPEMISTEILHEFTKKTGIKINAKNIETDAEACILMADESTPYDLALVSDYLVPQLMQKKLITTMNKEEIHTYPQLHTFFQKKEFVFNSVPYAWSFFGIGINKEVVSVPTPLSWNYLFQPLEIKICVPDEPLTLTSLGALGSGINLQKIGSAELTKIKTALETQKQFVEIYTDTNIALLFLNNVVPLAFASYKTIQMAHQYNQNISFVVPQEGGIVISNDWVMIANSKKQSLAKKFINFCLDE
ncbi:extracellular solute-binding protein, partial [Candidatus Dependentiae bacterium]|nr:extracellular solute-binding protein [Candidatus Dependentiae bacterium]